MPKRGRKRHVKINPKVEEIIKDYITEVHQKWNSNVFPSSQLAKVAVNKLEKPKTYYRNYHQMVKQILRKWEQEEICKPVVSDYESTQKSKKLFYQFPDSSIRQFQIEHVIPLPF